MTTSNNILVSPVDLDSWNISLFPKDLLNLFAGLAPVQLCSHSPVSTLKDDEFFKDWVFIGESPAYIRIDPQFKDLGLGLGLGL